MTGKTPTLHCTWILIAAGAWWLGTQRDDSTGETVRSKMADTAAGVRFPRGDGTGRSDSTRRASLDVSGDDEAWLQRFRGASGGFSPEQMAAAVEAALLDKDPVAGMKHFLRLLENLTSENAPAALQALKNGPDSREAQSWTSLLCAAWGSRDGATALAALTGRREREAALTGWAASDPVSAQQWLGGSGKPDNADERNNLQRAFVRGLMRRDENAALDYVTSQPEKERGDLVRVLARGKLVRGAPAAADWAGGLPDEAMRGAALEAVARHYMYLDPAAGAAWGAMSAQAPDMRQAVARIADRMAENDVRAAFAWTNQLPSGSGKDEALQQVFSEWARQDPSAASQVLTQMQPGPLLDSAIHSFSRVLVNESPEDAIVWATSIKDPAMRLDTQIDVARQWNATAPAAAQQWIAANLPTDARARALGGN